MTFLSGLFRDCKVGWLNLLIPSSMRNSGHVSHRNPGGHCCLSHLVCIARTVAPAHCTEDCMRKGRFQAIIIMYSLPNSNFQARLIKQTLGFIVKTNQLEVAHSTPPPTNLCLGSTGPRLQCLWNESPRLLKNLYCVFIIFSFIVQYGSQQPRVAIKHLKCVQSDLRVL